MKLKLRHVSRLKRANSLNKITDPYALYHGSNIGHQAIINHQVLRCRRSNRAIILTSYKKTVFITKLVTHDIADDDIINDNPTVNIISSILSSLVKIGSSYHTNKSHGRNH